jgi:hypothetical protein
MQLVVQAEVAEVASRRGAESCGRSRRGAVKPSRLLGEGFYNNLFTLSISLELLCLHLLVLAVKFYVMVCWSYIYALLLADGVVCFCCFCRQVCCLVEFSNYIV